MCYVLFSAALIAPAAMLLLLLAEAFETAVDAVPLAEEIEDDASDGLEAALERCGGMQTVAHRNSKATRRWPCAASCMAPTPTAAASATSEWPAWAVSRRGAPSFAPWMLGGDSTLQKKVAAPQAAQPTANWVYVLDYFVCRTHRGKV